jgi:pSer/pThr/pTyr-binding forkhead associated (FHA) protein
MNENPVLIASDGQLTGERWIVDREKLVIGRGNDCEVILPERQVSRYHAEILHETGKFFLHDLDSKNGTHLNGNQVKGTVPLNDGDEIQIALCVKLLFVGSDATVPLTTDGMEPKGKLELDIGQRAVLIDKNPLDPPLSLAQFRLLEALYEANGAVVDREHIVDVVWPGTDGIGVTEQAIDALIRRLRDRLTELDDHEYVVTVRGHGFRLVNIPI